MAILTFVMFTIWGFVRSFMNRPPGDYETEVCDIRLKDKKYNKALEAANEALNKTPNHRGAMMCKSLVFISEKKYVEADRILTNLIIFLEKNLEDDDKRINPNGGAIALGHPLGMSGARLALTAMRELQSKKDRYALCTMCIGVGQGIALLMERV